MNVFAGIQLPKILFETNSQYNGKIQIYEVGKTRKIVVNSALQSLNWDSPACERLYWGKSIDILKEVEPEMKNILLLGLGGGTLVHLVANSFPHAEIVSVEIDKTMVDIANNYFDLGSVKNHKVIIADAMKVIIEPEEFGISPASFQVVYVDIFIGEDYPDLGKSGNFLAALKRMCTPGGLIIFNRVYLEHHQDDVNNFINYVSEMLSDVKCLVVAGYTNSDNVLIYGRNT